MYKGTFICYNYTRGASMEDLKVGSVVKGTVTGVETYGIFVKINDVYSGLVHISEVSERFVKDINKFAELGETIYVEIKSIDEQSKKCILSIKELNYRIDDSRKLRESVRGFTPLKKNLPIWIKKKHVDIQETKM